MGQYDLGKLKELGGEGVSGLASRSDAARARELSKYGLDLSWFDQKVEAQQNLCSDCHKPEKSKLGNGKKRPLGLGFNSDGTPDRLICTNCASKQRKSRMEERNAPRDYSSFEEFWESNRNALAKENAAELARLRERDAEIREIYEIICIYLNYHDGQPCYQLTDTLDEIEAELVNNGTTDLDQVSCPFYRVEHRQLYDEIQAAAEKNPDARHARNSAIFAKFGLLIALPVSAGDHVVREFLRRNGRWPYPDWSKPPNPIKTVKCSTYQCKGEFTFNINDELPPAQWYCQECRAAQAARANRVHKTPAEIASDRMYVEGTWNSAEPVPAWFRNLLG